jgi:hypothetical protein
MSKRLAALSNSLSLGFLSAAAITALCGGFSEELELARPFRSDELTHNGRTNTQNTEITMDKPSKAQKSWLSCISVTEEPKI